MNRVSVLRESVGTRQSSNPYLTSAQGGMVNDWSVTSPRFLLIF